MAILALKDKKSTFGEKKGGGWGVNIRQNIYILKNHCAKWRKFSTKKMLLLERSIDIWRFVIFLFLFYFFEMVVFKRIPQNPFIYLFIAFSVLKYANENKTRCFMQSENTLFILAFSILSFARKINFFIEMQQKISFVF